MNRISVAGIMGTGKTTFASSLASHLNMSLVLEPFEDNPYLMKGYEGCEVSALKSQMWFIEAYHRAYSQVGVLDSYFNILPVYFNMYFNAEDTKLFTNLVDLIDAPPQPDLVIYLKASPNVTLNRIKSRNRGTESANITLEWITRKYNLMFDLMQSEADRGVNVQTIDWNKFRSLNQVFKNELCL